MSGGKICPAGVRKPGEDSWRWSQRWRLLCHLSERSDWFDVGGGFQKNLQYENISKSQRISVFFPKMEKENIQDIIPIL